MKRIDDIKKVVQHRKEVQRIAKEKGLSFPFHDFWKMINIALFGDYIATKLHRAFSGHHAHLHSFYYYKNAILHYQFANFSCHCLNYHLCL